MTEIVACEWCSEAYKAMSVKYKQAVTCDATVWFDVKEACWMLQGHYGSRQYDTMRFKFVRNPPTTDAYAVCDKCVTDRLEQGDLEEIPGSYL